ncbi:MAG: ABC transporter permease [Anaerolineae bacterium]|nr:ABC transporter permease [Anaerolineae bacterium]
MVTRRFRKSPATAEQENRFYTASQWTLIWYKFRRHKLAQIGGAILLVMYILAIFAPFFSPYDPVYKFNDNLYTPPTAVRFVDEEGNFGLRPFVYALKKDFDPNTLERIYVTDTSEKHYLQFFSHGQPYKLFGFISSDIHLFTVSDPARVFLFGTDGIGQDLFSRILHGAQISLSIGLVGVAISFLIGCTLGGISGYYGGTVDTIIQRLIEFLISIPTLPLWMGLSAALPRNWTTEQTYFAITIVLSLAGWTGLARVVRGKIISTRTETFVRAAELAGASQRRIIYRHLLPSFTSYLIVSITMAIPGMILGETSLSFLGLGLRPPTISWGVLLSDAQNVRSIALNPWLLTPAFFVVIVILAFNFVGDGLRDAADPYKEF